MTRAIATLCAVTLILSTGCRKTADNTVNYTAALNQYYAAHPVCLWAEPQRFPVQANTSDTTKTAPFDALVDQGLLARTTAEKKEMIVLSKQVTNYDLSDQGRGAWVADVNQPGFGNFCYGHFSVASIDSAAPTTGQPGATTQVSYRYGISGAPGWASAAETQNAFPGIAQNLAPNLTGSATLSDTANGWVVTSASGGPKVATSADGAVVE